LFDEDIDALEERFAGEDEEKRVDFLFLFDHVFGLDDESFFELRGVLGVGFGESVGESLIMNPCNGIIISLGITDLHIIKLIEAPEDIEDNNPISRKRMQILFKNEGEIILTLLKLTADNFPISPFGGIDLLGIWFFNVQFMFGEFAQLSVGVVLHDPPLVVEQVAPCVFVALFVIYVEG
jgi:hypothetical protein